MRILKYKYLITQIQRIWKCKSKVIPVITEATVTTSKSFNLQIYNSKILLEARHHAQAHFTSGTFIHCALSLAARRTPMAAQLGGCFRWPVFVMATLESQNIFCACTWSSNQSGGWGNFGSFQLPHSNSSPEGACNLDGYI